MYSARCETKLESLAGFPTCSCLIMNGYALPLSWISFVPLDASLSSSSLLLMLFLACYLRLLHIVMSNRSIILSIPSVAPFYMFPSPYRLMLLLLLSSLPFSTSLVLAVLFSADNPFLEKFCSGNRSSYRRKRWLALINPLKMSRLTYIHCGIESSSNRGHPHKRGRKKLLLGSPPPDTS